FEFTKTKGQPTNESLNLLLQELTSAAAGILTTLGGRNHGHVGMVVDKAEYTTFSNGGAKFEPPTNLGTYPTTVDENSTAICEKQVAELKELKEVFLTHEAVAHSMRTTIVNCVDEEWLAEFQSKTMGFNHRTPKEMLEHLGNNGGDFDHLDVRDRIKKQLVKTGQAPNPALCLAFALAVTEATGELESTLREWHAKGDIIKTFPNVRVYIQSKLSKKTKWGKMSAQSVGRGITNATSNGMDKVDEAKAATIAIAEVANAMHAQQNKQFKQMMELMKTLMQSNRTHKAPSLPPPPSTNGGGNE
ncbi:hypothetical protein ACHAW6_001488, partial [Cyclotella cf. meneghiniana]